MHESAENLLRQRHFVTAGGTETYLVFQQQFALREFCAFEIFDHPDELARLESDYLFPLMSAIAQHGHGLLLDALVWRAHPDYIAALGYAPDDLARINSRAVEQTRRAVARFRRESGYDAAAFPVLIAADIGPRGDGYRVDNGTPDPDTA